MNALNKITVTDIKELFTVSSPRGRKEEIRNRESYGLSFCAEGKITYEIDGKQAVSDEKHAVILPKSRSYSLYGNKTGIFPVINFDCKEFLCDEVISLPIQSADTYIKDFEKMKALSLFEENRAKMMSVFYNILHRLSTESSVRNVILPAIRYIESNYQNPKLSNAKLSEQCNISEVYFRKIFTETYKTTPNLLTGEEDTVNGDSGYIGAEKREDAIVKNKQGKKDQVPNQPQTVAIQEQIQSF